MRIRVTVALLTIVFAVSCQTAAPPRANPSGSLPPRPELVQLDYEDLLANRRAVEAGIPAFVKALRGWTARADRILEHPVPTITDPKKMVASSGDPHDFHTIGKYSWPNPNTPDGMPWIRQDGLINPDSKTDKYDLRRLERLQGNVFTLGIVSFYTRDRKYADKAAEYLRTWFIDPETRMNPNLSFASSQPGVHEGMPIGIIFSAAFIRMLDAVKLLPDSDAWTEADRQALRLWFHDFTTWLIESPFGIRESKHKNNHGSWYTAQVAVFSRFARDTARAEAVMTRAAGYFDDQLSPEGAFVYEQKRNRGLSYSVYSLRSLVLLANCSRYTDTNLWSYERPNQPGQAALKIAFEYLLPFLTGEQPWTGEEIGSMRGIQAQALPLYRQAARVYRSAELARAADIMAAKINRPVNLLTSNPDAGCGKGAAATTR